jgi:NAD+-dependent protein deacetylase SIR2
MLDLLFIIGTSLVVYPFAALPQFTSDGVPRILLNLESVENFGGKNDVFVPGDCDESIWKLSRKLNWHKELRNLHQEVGGVGREWEVDTDELPAKKEDELDADETVAELTRELRDELNLDKEEDDEIGRVERSEEIVEPTPTTAKEPVAPDEDEFAAPDEIEGLGKELEDELKLDKEEDLDIRKAASKTSEWNDQTENEAKPKDSKEKL